MMLRFCTFASWFAVMGSVFGGFCSPPEKIIPCTCINFHAFLTLECSSIKSTETIKDVFNRTGSTFFWKFELINSNITAIPGNSLSEKRFKNIYIRNSTLSSLFEFSPSANFLRTLTLENVNISSGIDWEQFNSLTFLTDISATEVSIPRLGEHFKRYVSKQLLLLRLLRTNTSHLDDNIFADHKELSRIEVQYGAIQVLKRSMFAKLPKIEIFIFNGNRIETLPDDLFSDMPNLKEIELKDNAISVMSEALFGTVYNNLMILGLQGNPLNCDCTMRWIIERETGHKQLGGTCATPEENANKQIKDLKPSDFKDCPRENNLIPFF